MNKYTVYTDGGATPNPGVGGWGVVIMRDGGRKELCGGEKETTNNRMELTAAITALEAIETPSEVDLHTDSQYIEKAINEDRLNKWIKDGWRNTSGAVKNADLWKRLIVQLDRHKINFHYVKAHADNEYNNRCDDLVQLGKEKGPGIHPVSDTLGLEERKMKKEVFRGIGTAMITPMTENGVDYAAMERLIERQIEAGIDALIVCATTGEAPTLTDEEHIELIRFSAEKAAGRVPIIAGTGSNYTDHAIEMSKKARDAGADALLCVTPYYNKCTQRGLVESYTAIADATDLPLIVYNVPGRTGVNIKPETYEKLAEHPNIAGIKEANGDISSVVETMRRVSGRLSMYSGNDDQIVPIMSMGGVGCISVLSNVVPAETREIATRFFNGDVKGAAELQMKYKPLIDALFCEVNPIPAKAAMHLMGLASDYARLPLTKMEPLNLERLRKAMRDVGIDV